MPQCGRQVAGNRIGQAVDGRELVHRRHLASQPLRQRRLQRRRQVLSADAAFGVETQPVHVQVQLRRAAGLLRLLPAPTAQRRGRRRREGQGLRQPPFAAHHFKPPAVPKLRSSLAYSVRAASTR